MAQLANQAAVQENGAADYGEPDAPVRVNEHGSVKGAWERFKGYLAGLVAALITTLYTVSFLLRLSLCADLPSDPYGNINVKERGPVKGTWERF